MQALAILLGASSYPRQPDLVGEASFLVAAAGLRKLVRETLAVPKARFLDLFDAALNGPETDDRIAKFLQRKSIRGNSAITDLFVFYVGHGGFREGSSEYCLCIRTTQKHNRFFHSLPLAMLATTIRTYAQNVRRFVVIDACFAGAAVANFQSAALDEVVRQKVEETTWSEPAIPDAGTAVLCASSKRSPAEFVSEGGTMFTDALLSVLREGDRARGKLLTFKDVRDLTISRIRRRHGAEGVQPELHVPDQSKGDISMLGLFSNPARNRILPAAQIRPRGPDDVALQLRLGNPTNATADENQPNNYLISRPQYAASYNAELLRPNWVSFELRRSDLGPAPRGDRFRADPLIPAAFRAQNKPFSAGTERFDRGHLCAPRYRRANQTDADAVFYLSNVVPQSQRYNQGAWNHFEEYCWRLCQAGYVLYIIAGADGIGARTEAGHAVPTMVWKVVVVVPEGPDELPTIDATARVFALRMQNSDLRLKHPEWKIFRTTVAALENELVVDRRGYSFFSALPAGIAHALKLKIDDLDDLLPDDIDADG